MPSTNTNTKASLKVVIRKRPVQHGERDIVEVDSPAIMVFEDKVKVDLTKYIHQHNFGYNETFGSDDSTSDLFDGSVRDLVENVFEGGTSTAFCFGQTNAGKTFTLFGEGGGLNFQELNGDQGNIEAARGGLYLLAAYDIFKQAEKLRKDGDICVKLSMYEIKGQKLHDLLNGKEELKALEDERGVLQLVGLEQRECSDLDEFLEVSNIGRTARTTAATGANSTSSRSHCAMLIRVFKGNDELLGKLSLIDLAGSERGADNDNTDKLTRMEGRQINTSLLALKEVIRAMQSGGHAPFRQSRLTQVLEESLTGAQCKTVVIACVSGADINVQHTVNTLRYASELRSNKDKPSELNRQKSAPRVKAEQRGDMRGRSRSVDYPGPAGNKKTNSVPGPSIRGGKKSSLNSIKESRDQRQTSSTPRGSRRISPKSGSSPPLRSYRNSSADDVVNRKNAYASKKMESDSDLFLRDMERVDSLKEGCNMDDSDDDLLLGDLEDSDGDGSKKGGNEERYRSNSFDEKENSFASLVVARFGNSAQTLLRFLKYKGVSGENDLAQVDENEIYEVAKAEGLKAIQLNKLREWVRSLHPGSSSRSSITLSKQNANLIKTWAEDEVIGDGNNGVSGKNRVVSLDSSSSELDQRNNSITAPTPSAMFNGGYKSQLFPNLESRSSLVEARFIADAMGFGWDGVGFDLYWEMIERQGNVFASADWPLTGNPLVTMLLLQRFLDKDGQFNKYLASLSQETSAKVALITAQHKMEMEEVGRALPKPAVIAQFENSWICPPSLGPNSANNFGAGGCMQLIDMLGMSGRVYFILGRYEEAQEAAELGLEMDDYTSNSSTSGSSTSGGSVGKSKSKSSKVKRRLSTLMPTMSKSPSPSSSSKTNPSIRIHCRRVLAQLCLQSSIESGSLDKAEIHYMKAIEDARALKWHSMELLIIMDLQSNIFSTRGDKDNTADKMMDDVCKKMKMAKPEVLSLFS